MIVALIRDPSELNKRITFGTVQSIELPSGVNKPTFVPQFSVWCKKWVRSLSQTYSLIGTEYQDTVTVVIRHNPAVNDSLQATLDGVTYNLLNVNPDESANPIGYDTVTLKKVGKNG
jgi:SPP1 family predicted phage head-tail adaptor